MNKSFLPWSIAEWTATFEGACLLTIFSAYCDESEVGTDDKGVRVFSVAAAFGEQDGGWIYFKQPWTAILEKHGVEYFRASQFEAKRGPYEDWCSIRRKEFHSDLIDVVNGADTMWFSCTLVLNDYEALTDADRKVLGTPYEFCAEWCARNISCMLNQYPWNKLEGLVHYVFEQRQGGAGRVPDSFERALKSCPERRLAGRPLWARKEDFVELQVADLFAYEVGKDCLRDMGVDRREPRKSLLALDKLTPRRHYRFDKNNLRMVIERGLTDFAKSDLEAARERGWKGPSKPSAAPADHDGGG